MLALLFLPLFAFAGRVRTLPTSNQEMPSIHLMTGRSTVIRFSSPPKKVIIGNQNYFNVEFIDSDVTLQPLGNTSSNMFVYGEGFTYGFILNVDHSSEYDDLVFIRTKIPTFSQTISDSPTLKPSVAKKELSFSISTIKSSKLELQGGVFKWNDSIKSFYSDIYVISKSTKPISIGEIKIQFFSGDQDLTTIDFVSEKDQLLPNVKTRVRTFANVNLTQKIKLKVQIKKEELVFDLKWKK